MNEADYWNYRQASHQLGLPVGTLYSMVSKKEIPHVRLGPRMVLFPVKEVKDWLNAHLVPSTYSPQNGEKSDDQETTT